MNVNFPRTLSLLRQEKKLSQRTVAEALGISQAVLSHYENGIREPGLQFVVRAADYYHVSTDFLLGRTMSREDYTTMQEIAPHLAVEDDFNEIGNEYATANKKLLVQSFSIIFDLAQQTGNRQLISDFTMYLGTVLYKLFRHLYSLAGKGPDVFFSIPESAWDEVSDAELALCTMRIRNVVQEGLPQISQAYLEQRYPDQQQSLLAVLHMVGKRLGEYL